MQLKLSVDIKGYLRIHTIFLLFKILFRLLAFSADTLGLHSAQSTLRISQCKKQSDLWT